MDIIVIRWQPPSEPLGSLIEDRYVVLKDFGYDEFWLCWDLVEQREVAVQALQQIDNNNPTIKLKEIATDVVKEYELRDPAEGSHLLVGLTDVLNDRYCVENLICDGEMSNVWLCWDREAKRNVIIKIPRVSTDFEAMMRFEYDFIMDAHEADPTNPWHKRVIELFDSFELFTRQSSLTCIVLRAMDGTLQDLLEHSKTLLPLKLVKNISVQVLQGLAWLHKLSIIHTDIKSANVLFSFKKSPLELTIKIADLGNAVRGNLKHTPLIQTPYYRSIEVVLGAGFDISADIWSAGCLIFELATSNLLFDLDSVWNLMSTGFNEDSSFYAQLQLVKLMMERLGPVPNYLISRGWNSHNVLTPDGALITGQAVYPSSIRDELMYIFGYPVSEAEPLAWFVEFILEYDPDKRPSAERCLLHPWLS